MNIFLVDKNPQICAQALCDLRLNKMILETGQMLCTAYRHWFPELAQQPEVADLLYRVTHYNHPCNVWLRQDIYNYVWLVEYFLCLELERVYRTGKSHLTFQKLYVMLDSPIDDMEVTHDLAFNFDCSNIYEVPIFTGHRFPGEGVFGNYKQCLVNKWLNDKRKPTWTKCGKPEFAKPYIVG